MAQALLRIARSFGFTLTVCGALDGDAVEADQHYATADLDAQSPTNGKRYIVMATQGAGDVAALASALAAPHAFVGSRRKFAAYTGKLADAGITEAALAGVRSPAGLHIGAVTPEEIALSIMAEIVQARRATRESESADG